MWVFISEVGEGFFFSYLMADLLCVCSFLFTIPL